MSTTSDRKFSILVKLFDWIQKSKTSNKRTKFRKFIDHFCNPTDYYSAIRLILPSLDRERGSYGLKESHLATSILDALAVSRDSDDGKKLINWRKGGAKAVGHLAGNFAAVAADVLQRRQASVSADVTIGEINSLLDRLAAAEDRQSKVGVLGELIRRTNWIEMKWVIMIILKDLKVGISEKSIFKEFHPDAEDLFNVTCDLRFVCKKLCDRNVRHKRKEIEVGTAVRPQLANRAPSYAAAWKRMSGKEVVVECKFDGDRIQVHKNGNNVSYFSRNYLNHDEYVHGMNSVILENVLDEKCILDGEMLVWDRVSNRFADFGANQETAKLARDGVDSDKQLCYVAFDVLFVGDSSVIHQSLKERHELLRKVVRPVKGRLEILLPNGNESINAHLRPPGEPCWSIVANHVTEVERFFKEMVENRYEGIVMKDLGSKWDPGDRGVKWLKVKPDYVKAGADLDVLIIGGYYGSGRRGGEIAQFLVGLAEKEKSSPNSYPRRFVSFCRVGTGLSDEELNELVMKLKPYFRKYEYPKKSPPSFYHVTNNSKERPDVWVESPEKSFILTITSDIRMTSSEVFAGPYSLRFPRIERVRYDKPWHECLDVESFVELVKSSNGTTQRGGGDDEGVAVGKPKRARTAKGEGRKKISFAVPSHFARTDVTNVKGESQVFANLVFYFVNVPVGRSLDTLHKLVAENGGSFSMNLNDTVTHCVGVESRGIKFEAAKRRGCDVVHFSWVLDCCSQKQLLPLMPKHYVFLSDAAKKKFEEEIDEFSDSYFWDTNVAELKQILCGVDRVKDSKVVDYYRKKYCPEKWCYLHGCRLYFQLFAKLSYADWGVVLSLTMRRMKVEVSIAGGRVVDNPAQATHIVVLSLPELELNFEALLQGFPEDKRRLLRLKRIHVVGSQWLEDCFDRGKRLLEKEYSLKQDVLEESDSGEEEAPNDMDVEEPAEPVPATAPVIVAREPKRKRGRPVRTGSKKAKEVVTRPPRPKRARVGKKAAKLQEIASEDETSEQEHHVDARAERGRVAKRPAKSEECSSDDGISKQDHHVDACVSSDIDRRNGVSLACNLDDRSNDSVTDALGEPGSKFEHVRPGLKPDSPIRKDEFKEDEMTDYKLDSTGADACSKQNNHTDNSAAGESDQIMVEPVQDMLLHLLPRVSKVSEAPKPVVEVNTSPPLNLKEGTSEVPKEGQVKKKVSLREKMNQLLKN